jgi:hypothetical protein
MVESTNSDLSHDLDCDLLYGGECSDFPICENFRRKAQMMGIDDCPEAKIEDAANKARTFNPESRETVTPAERMKLSEDRIGSLEKRVTELEDMLEHAINAAIEKIEGPSFNTAFSTPPDVMYRGPDFQEAPLPESVPVPVCPEHPDSVVGENGCTEPRCTWSEKDG